MDERGIKMWNYTSGFFQASYHDDDVSIESNIGPRDLQHVEAYLIHEYSVSSVQAHHYSIYTRKATSCGCFAKKTNVIIETFHHEEPPTDVELLSYFEQQLQLKDEAEQLPLNCKHCARVWSPVSYYSDTHYTNQSRNATLKIGFDPQLLEDAQMIYINNAIQDGSSKIYIQKPHCQCFDEAGKITLHINQPIDEQSYIEKRFDVKIEQHVAYHDLPRRCQICVPATDYWSPSKERFGHFEKFTPYGIMYSTFLLQSVQPTAFYEIEPRIFMLAQAKNECSCYEDLAQIESIDALSIEQFAQFLQDELQIQATYLSAPPYSTCVACQNKDSLILP